MSRKLFEFRGLVFEDLGIGLKVQDPATGRFHETGIVNKRALLRQDQEVPDVGIWEDGNTRGYLGSVRYPKPPTPGRKVGARDLKGKP